MKKKIINSYDTVHCCYWCKRYVNLNYCCVHGLVNRIKWGLDWIQMVISAHVVDSYWHVIKRKIIQLEFSGTNALKSRSLTEVSVF